MIAADQPKIFPDDVLAAVSSNSNGTIRHPTLDPFASGNIRKWCGELGVEIGQTVGVYITYGDDHTYRTIVDVEEPLSREGCATPDGWQKADALVTNVPGIGLLLPIADCNAVTIYDPTNHVIALAHLGWHATVNNLARELISHLVKTYGSRPADLLISFSPSIRRESYVFETLDMTDDTTWHIEPYATKRQDGKYEIDLVAYNVDQLVDRGVTRDHIEISPVNTATSEHYYSHFMRHQLGQTPKTTNRFAVVAMMR